MRVLPPLPGCGEPATVRIEVYGGDSLDAAAYACAEHVIAFVATIEAAGWSAHPVARVPELGRPCGHVYRYPTGGLADPPGDAHPRWCDRDGCTARRRHRSVRLPLTPRSPEPLSALAGEARADVALAQALVSGAEPVLVFAVGGAEPGELMLTLNQGLVLSYRLRRLLDLAGAAPARRPHPGSRPRNRRSCP
ncbi:hypothetical protein [Micromonospora rubida]|uniref:hypothetical protein n=1 Tax=Micromonospora rubida TaxID=2697657 RepID=UPI0013770B29|nr:hypothetical protein [Micromonospora rubida]NBE83106.1 hypothetical protein [Micromonospora rubida]